MSKTLVNPLGDVRAEADHAMLARAFYETPDYLSLLESDDKVVVVGRRGTGKSALAYRLQRQWSEVKGSVLVLVAPEEHQTLALAPLIAKTGVKFLQIRAVCRLLWRYGLILEIAQVLSGRYKVRDAISASEVLSRHLKEWGKQDQPLFDKLRFLLKRQIGNSIAPEEVIGVLADKLEIAQVERALREVLISGQKVNVLVDRLDEGFDPESSSVAFIDGAVSAAIDISTAFKGLIKPLVFLRDNIFRAVAHYDQDFTRNIEGQTLRLHWDVNNLFYLVCNRLRAAFGDQTQNNKRLWGKFTAHDLQGDEGFRQCLKFTLYRPRDILILLNSAFENASKRDLSAAFATIGIADLEKSAKVISNNRLDDLYKEYKHILPLIDSAVSVFSNRPPEVRYSEAKELLGELIDARPDGIDAVELAIFSQAEDLIHALYGVGFFGMHDAASGSYIFSHDGRRSEAEFAINEKLLIHPCYWMALNLTRNTLNSEEATDINDEYEIKVSSETPQLRNARLGRLINEYRKIPIGTDGAAEFEQWCLDALKICFAGRLDNIVLHPNKDAVNRRDVVGTNLAQTTFWRRVETDYGSRQVIFEIKNYEKPSLEDYRQTLSYLSGRYGALAFLVSRDWNINLEKDKELAWVRSMHSDHRKVVVKVSGKFFSDILSKFRNPQKHDAGDLALSSLLDTYERLYFGQQSGRQRSKSRVKPKPPSTKANSGFGKL